MKQLLIALITASCLAGCATLTEQKRTTQNIIKLPGMTQQQIFDRTLQWMARPINASKPTVEYQSAEEGKIVGSIITPFNVYYTLRSKIDVDIKDGKARMSIICLNTATLKAGETPIIDSSTLKKAKESVEPLFEDYETFMKGKEKKKKKENW